MISRASARVATAMKGGRHLIEISHLIVEFATTTTQTAEAINDRVMLIGREHGQTRFRSNKIRWAADSACASPIRRRKSFSSAEDKACSSKPGDGTTSTGSRPTSADFALSGCRARFARAIAL